jgi:hypothetical protein
LRLIPKLDAFSVDITTAVIYAIYNPYEDQTVLVKLFGNPDDYAESFNSDYVEATAVTFDYLITSLTVNYQQQLLYYGSGFTRRLAYGEFIYDTSDVQHFFLAPPKTEQVY